MPFHDEVRALAKKTFGERLLPDFVAMIKRYQDRGDVCADDPLRILRMVIGTFFSYVLTVVLVADRAWDDDAEIEAMVQVLSKGLRP